jgi:predicted nucleic-acid-binding Zn-ribbon protein
MKKCLRCATAMVEDLNLMVTNGGYGLDVREKGMFKKSLGKVKCAVCPECGYTEAYIDDTQNIKKLIEKNQ